MIVEDKIQTYDFIVVGGGSAGCILASRLAAAHYRVLLLEAGGSDDSWRFKIPVAQAFAFNHPKYDWRYVTEKDPTRYGYQEQWAAGKVLGGGSSLNGLIYMRGTDTDYDAWQQAGCTSWSAKEIRPFFQKVEKNLFLTDAEKSKIPYIHELTKLFVSAANHMGYPIVHTLTSAEQESVGYTVSNQYKGRRMNAPIYFKKYATKRYLNIRTNAIATQILFEGKKAIGVEYCHQHENKKAFSSKEIILCAGAIETPKLLLLSGIGDRDELQRLNIACHQHLPEVGKNLQEHPAIIMTFKVKHQTMKQEFSFFALIKNMLQWYFLGKGAFTSPVCQAYLFMKTSYATDNRPDIIAYFTPFSFRTTTETVDLKDENSIMIAPCVLRPQSRGYVSLQSNNPLQQAKIFYPFFSQKIDLYCLREACKGIREMIYSTYFKDEIIAEKAPGENIRTDEELDDYILKNAARCFHYSGTCRMGMDNDSVVNDKLQVYGVENLRIADTSIMPSIVSANTCASAMMIGEKAAALILEEKV